VPQRGALLKLVIRHRQTGSQKRTRALFNGSKLIQSRHPPTGAHTPRQMGRQARARVFCEDKPIPGTHMCQMGEYILINPSRIPNTVIMEGEGGSTVATHLLGETHAQSKRTPQTSQQGTGPAGFHPPAIVC
jgi:hypothetical protein